MVAGYPGAFPILEKDDIIFQSPKVRIIDMWFRSLLWWKAQPLECWR